MKKKVSLGDVFAVHLPDGRYGAIRVLNHIEKSYLIMTTPYISQEFPTLENDSLVEFLIQNRFFYNKKRALIWVDGKPPKELIHIGNIPLTEKEKSIPCSSFGGKWDTSVGMEVYLEWRWEHDRENLEREIKEEQEKSQEEYRKQQQKPKKMMEEEVFWDIISLLDIYEDDTEPAIKKLAKMGVRDIKQFEETMAYKLFLLDTKEHAFNNEQEKEYLSPDLFLYRRCFVVAKGKEFFESVLSDPKMMPTDESFEPLLSLASDAYERRTGKEFEYATGCNYETFSNLEGWK